MLRFAVPLVATAIYWLLRPTSHLLVILQLVSPGGLTADQRAALGGGRFQFNIVRNMDGHMSHVDTSTKEGYNYAFVTDSLADDRMMVKFEEKLNKLDFVKKHEVFKFSTMPMKQNMANLAIALKRKLSPFFPSLTVTLTPGAPLSPKDSALGQIGSEICSEQARAEPGPMVVINIMKVKDQEAADKYGEACFSFFPAIGTEVFLFGEARSDYWDNIALIQYASRDDFCSMGQSEEWRAVHHYKVEGYADTHTYITKEV